MRGIPVWMLGGLVVLSALLIGFGYHDRHEAGPLPLILGIAWALFTLASIGAKAKPADSH
ncbi:MAG: hypothetical protein IT200_02135 [Thermoleophilia bacterium]|nr:hypothetical protein [Thermoleophilia bacterium]